MSRIHHTRSALLLLLAAVCLAASSAQAQRNVQRTPEGRYALANKDVGDERWAIARDLETGVVTGNVYRADGEEPQLVWCWPVDAAVDPLRLRCQGTRGCDAWVDLGDVELAASFFEPGACEACDTAAEPASRRSGPVEPPARSEFTSQVFDVRVASYGVGVSVKLPSRSIWGTLLW